MILTHSRKRILIVVAAVLFISALAVRARLADAQSNSAPASTSSDHDLLAEYRRVEVASVSDALEQITGKKMYMSHRMQPIFTSKFAGYARTVQLKKDEGNKDPEALSGMLQAIDEGSTDSVYVMVVEDGAQDRIPGFRHGDRSFHFGPSLPVCRGANPARLQWSPREPRRHRRGG